MTTYKSNDEHQLQNSIGFNGYLLTHIRLFLAYTTHKVNYQQGIRNLLRI